LKLIDALFWASRHPEGHGYCRRLTEVVAHPDGNFVGEKDRRLSHELTVLIGPREQAG